MSTKSGEKQQQLKRLCHAGQNKKSHEKNEHQEIIRIRNGPAENHKGSQSLGESHGTKDNLNPRTNNFSAFPKEQL